MKYACVIASPHVALHDIIDRIVLGWGCEKIFCATIEYLSLVIVVYVSQPYRCANETRSHTFLEGTQSIHM